MVRADSITCSPPHHQIPFWRFFVTLFIVYIQNINREQNQLRGCLWQKQERKSFSLIIYVVKIAFGRNYSLFEFS